MSTGVPIFASLQLFPGLRDIGFVVYFTVTGRYQPRKSNLLPG